jgi:hypothetical protein
MMRVIHPSTSALLLTLTVLPLAAAGQQTPEAARLGSWVGSWTSDDYEGGFECEWFGQSAVVCRSEWAMDSGEQGEAFYVNRWDAESEQYTAHRFYDTGYADSGRQWVDGNTWTVVFVAPEGALDRIVWTVTPEKAEYTWHRSVRGGSWEEVATHSFSRVQ